MIITTTRGNMDESLLLKRTGETDNDNEHTTWVEYCVIGCDGLAHSEGKPDSDSFFCSQHVHRSAHVTLKKPVHAFGEAASLE